MSPNLHRVISSRVSKKQRLLEKKKDQFTTLTDDCLFSVLKYLDRDSSDIMECVSKKMNFLINYKGRPKPKRNAHHFMIKQYGDGHVVIAEMWSRKHHSLVYRTEGNLVIKEQFKGHQFKFIEVEEHALIQISDNVFKGVEALTSRFATQKLNLEKIRIDKKFLNQLVSSFQGLIPKYLSLMNAKIDEGLNMLDFVLQSKICEFEYLGYELHVHAQFDEEFMRRFSLAGGIYLSIHGQNSQNQSWTPTKQFLPIICHFNYLAVGSLHLTIELLEELIVVAFEQRGTNRHAYWSISLSDPFDRNNLRHINNGMFTIEEVASEHSDDGEIIHLVGKKNHDARCEIKSSKNFRRSCFVTLAFSESRKRKRYW